MTYNDKLISLANEFQEARDLLDTSSDLKHGAQARRILQQVISEARLLRVSTKTKMNDIRKAKQESKKVVNPPQA